MIQEVFEGQFAEVRKKAENYLLSKFRVNYFDAQDILQNASIKAYSNFSSFKGISSFGTWYISIVRNEALTMLLKKQKSKEVEDSDDLIKNYSFSWVEPEINNFDKTQEIKDVLNKAISSLSEKHKQVLVLILKDSLSHQEIAAKLNIPINSVRTRLFYAKKTLKKVISFYALN